MGFRPKQTVLWIRIRFFTENYMQFILLTSSLAQFKLLLNLLLFHLQLFFLQFHCLYSKFQDFFQMYDIDEITGVVRLSFSADATCTNGLHSPWEGFETMVLTPLLVQQSPSAQKAHACTFPDWARGKWQDLEVRRFEFFVNLSKQIWQFVDSARTFKIYLI